MTNTLLIESVAFAVRTPREIAFDLRAAQAGRQCRVRKRLSGKERKRAMASNRKESVKPSVRPEKVDRRRIRGKMVLSLLTPRFRQNSGKTGKEIER